MARFGNILFASLNAAIAAYQLTANGIASFNIGVAVFCGLSSFVSLRYDRLL